MKNEDEIGKDCNLDQQQRFSLGIHLSDTFNNAHDWVLTPLIRKLYERIKELEQTNDQNALNIKWMIEMMDKVHAALCPDLLGTWQQRAEQAVKAAIRLEVGK